MHLRRRNSVFAGADLKEVSAGNGAKLATRKGGFAGITRRERIKPLIAAIQGTAVAGCEISLACDFIVASTETVFGLAEVKRFPLQLLVVYFVYQERWAWQLRWKPL